MDFSVSQFLLKIVNCSLIAALREVGVRTPASAEEEEEDTPASAAYCILYR